MPKSKEQHLRYRIIDQELRRRSWVKSRDLQQVIEDTLQESVNLRTIQKDIQEMKEDTRLGFNAPIEYDKQKKAYRYADRGYSIGNFSLQSNEIAALKFYAACLQLYSSSGLFKDFSSAIDKIISGINLKQQLRKSTNPDLIIQTDTILPAAGVDWLEFLVQAIDEQSNISFKYKKFIDGSPAQTRIISPYLLREYNNRWYVLGMVAGENRTKTFGLDRMTDLEFSPGEFRKDLDFNPEVFFKHSFGITLLNEPVQKIVLQFSKEQILYVKSLPIHPTQIIMEETPDQITISIEVIPSYELYEYILGKTPDIRVVYPKKISDRIADLLKKGLEKTPENS